MRISGIAAAVALAGVLAAGPAVAEKPKSIGEIERLDPAFDKLVPPGAVIEVLADGFEWSEGPEYNTAGKYLLFSDIPNNRIVKWKQGDGISVYLEPSGYTGKKAFTGSEPGTNGLMYDAKGNLWMCCHGDRAIKMQTPDGKVKTVISEYEGKRLNSPNDLVFDASGALYFTDPPYGLPERYEDPARELDWCGVYRYADGKLTLLTKEMTRPNGIALSPDQKTLYVAQSDPEAAIWKSFPVKADGTLGPGKLFYDATKYVGKRPGLPDGLAVDTAGNLWATGPGGVYVFSPEGKVLGRLSTGERTANCTFGADGKTLFITADMYLCRVKTLVKGLGEK
ncbi:SMP-30/gluconolactonase/LRE family protein [Lignipirellula cremea]|uniref:Gluconolactonase n=1 Tax=Lignipirellula cremea TaxID=2528010 RepID=A0A518DRW1_9BACT|nr:SMP-30/gluconolactonase/LRE family protein [Lignipirellula cremea]QDU94576.1 Gluconolactonase precursor [Lignipirellula cremea]